MNLGWLALSLLPGPLGHQVMEETRGPLHPGDSWWRLGLPALACGCSEPKPPAASPDDSDSTHHDPDGREPEAPYAEPTASYPHRLEDHP